MIPNDLGPDSDWANERGYVEFPWRAFLTAVGCAAVLVGIVWMVGWG